MFIPQRLLSPSDSGGAPDPKSDEAPRALTEEDVGRIVNAAVTSHLKRSIPAALGEALKEINFGAQIEETVKKLVPAAPDPKPDDKAKPDPRVAALEENIKALDAKYKAAESARQAAEQKSRDDAARAGLRTALQQHVRPEALDMAAKLLFDADKRVSFDESGQPLFTVKRAPVAGMPEEDTPMPLSDGVAHWLKTEEAKLFLPAPAPRDDGRRGPAPRPVNRGRDGLPQYDAPATTDAEKLRRVDERTAALLARMQTER